MKQDRFLTGILIFIVVLVAAAVALFFVRNHPPAYGPEDTPAGVIYNYTVAVEQQDYTRAYSYLAKQDNEPSFEAFQRAFLTKQIDPSNTAVQIGETQMPGTDEAWVSLTIQYAGNGVFNQGYSNSDRAELVRQQDGWKITSLPYPYWGVDWYQVIPTPVK